MLSVLTACEGKGSAYLLDGGSGTTAGSTMSTGGTSSGTAGTTQGISSGTSGTASSTTGGSTGIGLPVCAWVNDVCALPSCANASIGEICALDDGGLGLCHGGQCTNPDFSNDAHNCGWFGLACPEGDPCTEGACVPPIDCAACPQGYACWRQDHTTPFCLASDCAFARDDDRCSSPGASGFCCGGSCIAGDPSNCGGCGVTCGPGAVCGYDNRCWQTNSCEPESATNWWTSAPVICALPSGSVGECCGGACVDISEPAHCGSCDVACPNGGACLYSGTCSTQCQADADCPDGYQCFNRSYCQLSRCDPGSDGVGCVFGASWEQCCAERCADLTQDPANCGRCGAACKTGESCLSGECVTFLAPEEDGQFCAMADGGLGTVCDHSCVDLQNDAAHCIVCDRPCPTGATCVSGQCSLECLQDADCPLGSVCYPGVGECLPPCNSTNPFCDSGSLTCCGNACVDTTSDPANCGSCGIPCPAVPGIGCFLGQCVLPDGGTPGCLAGGVHCPFGFACLQEWCVPIFCGPDDWQRPCALNFLEPPSYSSSFSPSERHACCGDACVDMNSDPLNCGGCGIECPSGFCSLGLCVASPLTDDCPQSCGVGTTCADAMCVDSRCDYSVASRCLAEDGAVGICCWPLPANHYAVACANLTSDPFNCGACGITCPPGAACLNGLCNGLAACGPGHQGSYCNVDAGLSFLCCPGLGCIDTASDSQNCGACASACSAGQTCQNGTCTA